MQQLVFKLLTSFLDRQIPLTTTRLVVVKILGNSGVGDTIGCTIATNVSRRNSFSVKITKRVDQGIGVHAGGHLKPLLYVYNIV